MNPTLLAWLRHLSRICGFETANSFPRGHRHARTRWDGAYFDIASDVKPDQIERRLSDAIANTPLVFAHITNPTPQMQRALLGVLEERMRRHGNTGELAVLLIGAYRSAHIQEAIPGLRAEIRATEHEEMPERVSSLLAFLIEMQAPFDVIELPS